MMIKKKEIGNLKAFFDFNNGKTASFSFKVNDGGKNSEEEYIFEFNYDDANKNSDEEVEEFIFINRSLHPNHL